MGDNEFECIRNEVQPPQLHIAPPDEHIGEVERSVRTIKERTRCIIHDLPYRQYPRAMVEGCVTSATMSLNNLPSLDDVSKRLSPASMIVGRAAPDFNTISKLNFGDYVKVYQGTTNTTKQRTVSAIALYPAPQDGSWIYM